MRLWLGAVLVCGLLLGLGSPAQAVSIASGDIVVADPGAGLILKIDPVTGGQGSITAKIANSVTTRSNVFAVWITIGFFTVEGGDGLGPDLTISPGGLLNDPVDITRARSHGAFYIVDRSLARPFAVDMDTGAQSLLPGPDFLIQPSGVAFDEVSEDLFISDESGSVFRFNPVTGVSSTTATGGSLIAPSDLDVAPDGTLYVLDPISGTLIEIDPDTGVQTVRAVGVPWTRLSIETNGLSAIVLDPTTPALRRVDLATGAAALLASGGSLSTPVDLVVVPPAEASVPALGWGARLLLLAALGVAATRGSLQRACR